MAISLLTNVPSIDAQRNLNNTQVSLNKNISHLSSGLRITSASDDAAGLALSTHLLSQARGYTVAGRNANDGISVIQVAEGAIGEQSNILLRLRDLALQSANGVYSSNDRSYLDTERSSLESEIDRIANVTNFNGTSLLNAAATVDLQVGISNSANDKITVNFVDTKVGTLGLAAKIDTQKNAQTYIGEVDTAIDTLSKQRSSLGAAQNRLESVVRTVGTAGQNTYAANSRIQDVDVASETASLTRNQILSQAGVAVLSQANQLPSSALSLLGR